MTQPSIDTRRADLDGKVQDLGYSAVEVERLAAQCKRHLAESRTKDRVLDDARKKQVDRIFNEYDPKDDGFLTMQAFRRFVREKMEWSDKLYPAAMAKLDSVGDGTLSKVETQNALVLLDGALMFDKMDEENTGSITKNKWLTAAMQLKFSVKEAELVFNEFDDDANGVMDYDEFLECMKDLQGVFMMNDVQDKIDATKANIQKIEVIVQKILAEISGSQSKREKAERRRKEAEAKKEKAKAVVDEHLTFFSGKKGLIQGHREHLDVMHMTLTELKQKFKEYKSDLHQAFENKQYDVCVELSSELSALKYELDEQTGAHELNMAAHANESSLLETKQVSHAQADVELRHLHDLLVEAESHHDEIATAHRGALQELQQAESDYETYKASLALLEEQGARAGLISIMSKMNKSLGKAHVAKQAVKKECNKFDDCFKLRDFKQIAMVGKKLIKHQDKQDKAEKHSGNMMLLLIDKKRELEMIERRNRGAMGAMGSNENNASAEFDRGY